MRFILPILIRLLPFMNPLLAAGMAELLNAMLSCSSIGKRPQPCGAFDANFGPVLGAMFWWGILLWVPGMLFSAALLSRFLREQLPAPWGRAGKTPMR